jgi:hypothetical protein
MNTNDHDMFTIMIDSVCSICPLYQGPLTMTTFPEKSAENTGIVESLGIGFPLWNAFLAALSILWDLQSMRRTHANCDTG